MFSSLPLLDESQGTYLANHSFHRPAMCDNESISAVGPAHNAISNALQRICFPEALDALLSYERRLDLLGHTQR